MCYRCCVQKAVEGDIVSINKVMKHYEGYISCLSVRKMYDEIWKMSIMYR